MNAANHNIYGYFLAIDVHELGFIIKEDLDHIS